MKPKLFFSIIVILTAQIFPQLKSIKEFPKEYESQEIRELTPVWISENEILVFYTISTLDTIYSRRTTNRGHTWSAQKFEQIVEKPEMVIFDLAVYKTSTGRILIVWNSISDLISCTYSDDNGYNWVNPFHIPGYSLLYEYSLTELDQGEIVLSFALGTKWRTRFSLDNGETWSDQNYFEYSTFPRSIENPSLVKLSESGNSLLGIFSLRQSGIIYSILSTDAGVTWSDTSRITEAISSYNPTNNISVKAIRDQSGLIWLVYNSSYDIGYEDYFQTDITVLLSTDNGITWQQEDRFTSYLGNDRLSNVASNGNDILITFSSARRSETGEAYYGTLGESADIFTPPVLVHSESLDANFETYEVSYRALVIDDDEVSKVITDMGENNVRIELFDDGIHNDSLAGDNIFGNILPIVAEGRGGDAYAIDVNKITLPFTRRGVLADVNVTGKGFSFELEMTDIYGNAGVKMTGASVPLRNGSGSGGKFQEAGFLFSGGFFLSGYSNGNLWSNGVASATLVGDYIQGNVGSDRNDLRNVLYIVNERDPAFGSTWQSWRDAVMLGADFYDGDDDGIYNPVDKNWNGTWDVNEDMPMLIGDETIWCVYNDGIPANLRRWNSVEPQGIEIRQTVFASDNPDLENVVFIKYSILNTGTVADEMDSVYFGIWEDGDLGDPTDDAVGCDTLLNSGFYYNNTPDGIFGENCPSFFTTILQGPIFQTNEITDSAKINYGALIGSENISGARNQDISAHNFLIGGNPNLNDPRNKIEARNYIEGKNRIGEYPNPCNFAYCQVRGSVNCNEVNPHFWASGDPVNDIGWISRMNIDHKNLVSTGPFRLEKEIPQEIIIAYVIGRGEDFLNSITVTRENVRRAIEEYESNFASMTYTPPPPTAPVVNYVLYQNYPNPFNPVTTIRYELPQDGIVTIDIYDILGQKVKTVLNEFKQASRYEINFNAAGLASGVYIYRMKVNDFITSKKMILIR